MTSVPTTTTHNMIEQTLAVYNSGLSWQHTTFTMTTADCCPSNSLFECYHDYTPLEWKL